MQATFRFFGHALSPHNLCIMILACHITDIMIKWFRDLFNHEQRIKHL